MVHVLINLFDISILLFDHVQHADMAFIWDKDFKKYVEMYAADEELFFKDFSAAFQKLEELGCTFDKAAAKPWYQFW